MVVYFSPMYQAIPALYELYKRTGGVIVTTRINTFLKVRRNFPDADVRLVKDYLPNWWPTKKLLSQANLIVTGAPYRSFLAQFPAKKAMIFHGTYTYAGKAELERLRHFDFFFSFGRRMTDYLCQGGYKDKIIESGYLPFLGFKQLNKNEKRNLYRDLNLSPFQPTLLYMPMGGATGSWELMAERVLKETPSEFNLILRPHPSYNANLNLFRTLKLRKIKSLCKKRGNTLLDQSNLTHSTIFNITDVLICDGGSAPEEALFYNIPIMFIETEHASKANFESMMRNNGLNEDYIEKALSIYDCAVSLKTNDSVAEKIKQALNNSKVDAQNTYFKWVFNETSTDRQLDVVSFIVENFSNQKVISL